MSADQNGPVNPNSFASPNKFDRIFGSLESLPDVTKTKPTTITAHTPLVGSVQTFIIQTLRQKDEGDWVFLQYVDESGTVRIPIPPRVTAAIARQRDSLSTKIRSAVATATAQARKAAGILPGFMKHKGHHWKKRPKNAPAAAA